MFDNYDVIPSCVTSQNRFHLLVLALYYRNVFSRSDDVRSLHLLLCDVKMLSVLIENIVLEKSQENVSITSVFITLL